MMEIMKPNQLIKQMADFQKTTFNSSFDIKPNQLIKQMVDFQKTTFNSSFNTMAIFQTRMEKMSEMFIEQVMWGSEKWRYGFTEWLKVYQDGCDRFKKVVDSNLAKMENYVSKN